MRLNETEGTESSIHRNWKANPAPSPVHAPARERTPPLHLLPGKSRTRPRPLSADTSVRLSSFHALSGTGAEGRRGKQRRSKQAEKLLVAKINGQPLTRPGVCTSHQVQPKRTISLFHLNPKAAEEGTPAFRGAVGPRTSSPGPPPIPRLPQEAQPGTQ